MSHDEQQVRDFVDTWMRASLAGDVATVLDLVTEDVRLSVTVTPQGGDAMERAGHTLTVLRREQGRWRIARDANLLVTMARPA
jgi:ketosteroid isomerase-like protein